MTYSSEVLADSPWGFWPLTETSGTSLADSSGSSRAMTITGSAHTLNQAGPTTLKAITWSTATGYAGTTATSTLSTISIEVWVYLTANPSTNTIVVGHADSYHGTTHDKDVYVDTTGKVHFFTFDGANNDLAAPSALSLNTWHHIVGTVGAAGKKLYIDNSVVASNGSTTSYTAAAQKAFVRGGGSDWQGTGAMKIASPAIYSTQLSPTRVGVHYTTGSSVDGGYTAQAMTASADTVMPAFSNVTNAGYTAQAMTATATTVDAVGQGNVRRFDVTEDAPSGVNIAGGNQYLKLPMPTLGSGEFIASATLYVTPTSSATDVPVQTYRITSDWNETSFVTPSVDETALTSYVTDVTANVAEPIDVSAVVSQTNYGVRLYNVPSVASSENATTAKRPYVVYTIGVVTNGGYTAGPMTASGTMADPVTSTSSDVSTSGQPMTATASMVSPSVLAEHGADIAPEPISASAELGDARFSLPATATADALTASVDIVGASIATTQGVIVNAAALNATSVWKKPAAVNGAPLAVQEADDNYFLRVMSLSPTIWYRMNDTAYYAANRMGDFWGGTAHGGVYTGQFNGPEGRGSFHFDGTGSIEQSEPSATNTDEALVYDPRYGIPKSTLEFSIRTTKANQFIMASKDDVKNLTTGTETETPPKEIFLKDGKIDYRSYTWDYNRGTWSSIGEFTGFKNLADGQWHTINIRSNLSRSFDTAIVEIWVDGSLEIRRLRTNSPGQWYGFPDWIGGRPDAIDGYGVAPLASSAWFEGDMSEVAFYPFLVPDDSIPRLYYDFMGWKPIAAGPIEAFAFTPDGARGKGNQKRALALKWYEAEDGYDVGGSGFNNKMNFDPLIGIGSDFAGYKVFWRSVDDDNGNAYRDPVTDAPTLIDLERDVDIDDYDIILFRDWPDEGNEFDDINRYYPGDYERLVKQLRWANDRGVGLFVTHPRLAVDLGIIDRVEFVPTLAEHAYVSGQGNASGLYDYGSAVKFPWNISGSSGMEGNPNVVGSTYNGEPQNTDPAFLANKAYFYGDTNKNDRFRIRALVEGLTDIPSYMIEDAIYQKDFSSWGWSIVAYKYAHRLGGLQIGDEYLFHGTNFGYDYDAVSADLSDVYVGRWFGYYAAPLNNVKAGTVVTTFGDKLWQGSNLVDNPYSGYATTIVLQPGDTLGGTPVAGRIYVNFTEQPSRQPDSVVVQQLPLTDAGFPPYYRPDTAAQREWEWSDTRKSLTTTGNPSYSTVTLTLPDGSLLHVTGSTQGGSNLQMTRSSNLFPIVGYPSWQMNRRGLFWLSQAPEHSDDDAIVRATPLEASAAVVNPTVTAQRDAHVNAQPMVGLAVITRVAEDQTGDADNYTLPMTAEATFTGFGRTVSATPMTATAVLVENFDMVHASGEQIVLTLQHADATLFLKEEV